MKDGWMEQSCNMSVLWREMQIYASVSEIVNGAVNAIAFSVYDCICNKMQFLTFHRSIQTKGRLSLAQTEREGEDHRPNNRNGSAKNAERHDWSLLLEGKMKSISTRRILIGRERFYYALQLNSVAGGSGIFYVIAVKSQNPNKHKTDFED